MVVNLEINSFNSLLSKRKRTGILPATFGQRLYIRRLEVGVVGVLEVGIQELEGSRLVHQENGPLLWHFSVIPSYRLCILYNRMVGQARHFWQIVGHPYFVAGKKEVCCNYNLDKPPQKSAAI